MGKHILLRHMGAAKHTGNFVCGEKNASAFGPTHRFRFVYSILLPRGTVFNELRREDNLHDPVRHVIFVKRLVLPQVLFLL